MNTLHPKRYELRHRNYWTVLALVIGFVWCVVEPLEAQRTGGYRGRSGIGRTNPTDQATQKAQEALEKIETAATMLLTDHILQATPPAPAALPKIQSILETNKKFQGKFPKERKAYLYVLESLLAHYSGDQKTALDKARRAYREDPKNPDLSDLIIVLSLCYENYDVAKEAFAKRKVAGSAVLGKGLPVSGARINRGPREPNLPGILRSRAKEPNTVPRPLPGTSAARPGGRPPSKWDQLLNTPSEQQPTRPGIPGRTPTGPGTGMPGRPGGTTMPRGMPQVNPRMNLTQSAVQNYQTILNLPVEYMLSKELGKDFPSMNLRSINGSYFPIASGKGQIYCALLWTSSSPHPSGMMPRTVPRLPGGRSLHSRPDARTYFSEEESYGGRSTLRPRMPMAARPGISAPARVIPKVAFDLDSNENQFRDLFLEHITEGKIGFVGINYDTSISVVKEMLYEDPLPWPTCLLAEGVNTQQWPLPNITGALLLMVDTKGKIRYIGPVGGFLPQMLLDRELGKATTTAANVPDIPMMSDRSPSGSTSSAPSGFPSPMNILPITNPQTALVSVVGYMLIDSLTQSQNKNQDADQTVAANHVGTPLEPNVPVRTKPAPTPPAIPRKAPSVGSRTSPAVTLNGSNLEARNLLRVAQMQRRLTPISALRSCDEVLERWPNSTEAQEAKTMILSLLENGRLPNNIKEERKRQGKYIGEN